jgi:predicted amino acid racemase
MSSATPNLWIALIAAVGIGSIVSAVVGWVSAKAVTISNHRQNWINALRDDLVAYLREIDTMHYRMAKVLGEIGGPGTIEDLERQQENRAAALLVYRRILLRLNTTEDQHVQLAKKLKGLLVLRTRTTDTQQVDDVVSLARQVLKHEWAVTKYGMFTKPVVSIKAAIKGMDDPSLL